MSAGEAVQQAVGGGRGLAARRLEKTQWRQLALITVAAIGIFFGLRALPTGTSLSHMDFRVDPKAGKAIEFCDPANPQFIPVVAVKSPVVMTLTSDKPARAGEPVRCTVTLQTASGKPVGPEDVLYTHTRKMHLLIVDESLQDYQHVHPDPGERRGEWRFAFTPHRSGGYRVFADFTPAATSRGLYASVDLPVGGNGAAPNAEASQPHAWGKPVRRSGYQFSLTPLTPTINAGKSAELALAVSRDDGGVVPLEPVMDALAHLVAFDAPRSGFAHLHPVESDLDRASGPNRPVLKFRLTIPQPGPYVIWAQVNLAGTEMFVPFWFEVQP